MIDFRVTTFLTLYECMNYHETAEILNMTQPGVTRHIKYLEKLYDIKLFEYRNRKLCKTAYTDIFKKYVDSVIASEKEMLNQLSFTDTKQLNVGATQTIAKCSLTPFIKDFIKNTNQEVNIHVDTTPELLRKIKAGELDFAIVEGIFDKSIQPHHLFKKERFLGICAKTHKFANKTVPLEETFNENLIVREYGSGNYERIDKAISIKGYSEKSYKRVAHVNNFHLMADILADGDGIAFAYEPLTQLNPELTTFEIEGISIDGEFNFIYMNRYEAEEKIKLFFGEDYYALPDILSEDIE